MTEAATINPWVACAEEHGLEIREVSGGFKGRYDEAWVTETHPTAAAVAREWCEEEGYEPPEAQDYSLTLAATFRAYSTETIRAASIEEAKEIAAALDFDEFSFEFNECQQRDGDELVMIATEDGHAEEEADLREPGEPYSWDACELVKQLARMTLDGEMVDGEAHRWSATDAALAFEALIVKARRLLKKDESEAAG